MFDGSGSALMFGYRMANQPTVATTRPTTNRRPSREARIWSPR